MKNELNQPLKEREEKLRKKLLEEGNTPEKAEEIVTKARENYAEDVLTRLRNEFPQPLAQTARLNREVWADGVIDEKEMSDLLKNQGKLEFNFMIMRDLMTHLTSQGEYAQHGKLFDVRDKYERLRRAMNINKTSLRRARYSKKKEKQEAYHGKKDRSIMLHLTAGEIALVQGMLKGMGKQPQKQDERKKELPKELSAEHTR